MFLTFSSFAVKATETGDRLSVTVTLLLTSVAFKFVVSQNLPTISYLTVLVSYIFTCVCVCVGGGRTPLFSKNGENIKVSML